LKLLKKYQTKNIGMLPRLGEFDHCRELFNINASKVIDGCIYVRIGGDINIDDQYKIYERSPSDPSSLQSLCDAADLGPPRAQLEVGARYALGIYGVQVDHIRAYVWYSLANRGCYDDVRYELLKQGMATQQIAEAELMLADWEPGQCEKALIRKQIND